MNRYRTLVTALAIGIAWLGPAAAEQATPEEVIAKVRGAAAYLAEDGDLAAFDAADSEWVWKDTYVFVYDCEGDVIAGHPVAESRNAVISELRDGIGAAFGIALCAAAGKDGGSWAEYDWRRPTGQAESNDLAYVGDHVRKVSFMLTVDGTPYQVGAGIFDEDTSLDELDALSAQ